MIEGSEGVIGREELSLGIGIRFEARECALEMNMNEGVGIGVVVWDDDNGASIADSSSKEGRLWSEIRRLAEAGPDIPEGSSDIGKSGLRRRVMADNRIDGSP
jgi:hypothetical protein